MRDRCGRGRFKVCGRMFLSVFGSGFLQASQKIAERNRVLARARSRRSLRAYDPLWVQFVVHVCVGAKNRKKNRKALGKNASSAVLEFAGCAPLWFLEIRVLPPDGLRGAFKSARDGLHLQCSKPEYSLPLNSNGSLKYHGALK